MEKFYKKVDYRYNIRGWLLEINNTQDLSSGGGLFNDLFSFKINYNTVDNSLNNTVKALYNGNIAEIYWRTAGDNVLRKYGYSYDQMNRLLSAVYQKPGATTQVTNAYNETLSYDANGNISTLTRTGEFDDQLHNLQIDNLAYFYHPTRKNQLMKVTDYQNNPNGFKDDSDGTNDTVDDYSYDGFGNMLSDANKNISIIRYNHFNLPTLVDFGVAGKIEYLYNAAGVKVQKKVTEGTLITITDYLNGFQYIKTGSNPVELEFFPHAEGYVKVTDGNVYNYVYNYTDHLGNVRLSYTKDPASNVLTILEENNYYPFGLKHRNYNMSQKQYSKLMSGGGIIITPTNQTVYDYKLNGKEYQDELGLNMYAMDMRQYDPAIGRWVVQDPVTHFDFSPYNAFDNNPVFWSDPSGADSSVPELYDGLGRQKYDYRGMYITPDQRGDISHDVMTQLFEMRRKSERMGGVKEFVLPPGVVDFFAEGKAENELFRIYDADGRTAHVFYASFFESGLNHAMHQMMADIDPPTKGKTSDGQLYGGDGSGSASDLFRRFVYETDQFNPIALVWDGIKGHLTGSDRYGNSITSSQSNLKLATAIPIGKYASVSKSVWSHIFRNAAGHVNPATLSSQMRYYKLFQGVASNPANLVPTVNASARMAGVQTFNQTFRGGSTVWVQTINGRIINAGVNLP